MNVRWGFDRPERRTATVVVVGFLLLLHLNLSSCWSLGDGGLALLKFGDRVVRCPFGDFSNWNTDGGEEDGAFFDRKVVALEIGEHGDLSYRRMLQGAATLRAFRAKTGKANQRAHVPSSHGGSSSSPFNRISSSTPLSASVSPSSSPIESPSPSPSSLLLVPSPSPLLKPIRDVPLPVNRPVVPAPDSRLSPSPASTSKDTKRGHSRMMIMAGVLGGVFVLLVSVVGFVFFRSSKVITVKPWATGLSGQLQKAFVTGVPKLNRSEILAACEDFSNIIGSFSEGTVYKGTLSSGVEIAVASNSVKSSADWSENSEEQFRKKIEKLSKVNHKNFVNLIGFCEEEQPFTRIMVFEYAPNGTLFEHLHVKESEHLDWGMRLRIAMGMAYCLEHLHQLTPPITHRDLHSSSIYLTEDYAAKISEFRFWNEMTARMQSAATELLEIESADLESNVYSFGMILFEMITGMIPDGSENSLLSDWKSESLKAEHSLRGMVDPTLKSFDKQELEKLFQVIVDCVNPDPKERPTMVEIAARLKEITAMGPDGATPKLSPLWWAELEIISSEGS